MTKKKQDEWQFFRKPSGHIAYNKKCLHWSAVPTANLGEAQHKSIVHPTMVSIAKIHCAVANVSKATARLFSDVTYSINGDDRIDTRESGASRVFGLPPPSAALRPNTACRGRSPQAPTFAHQKSLRIEVKSYRKQC